MRFRQLTTISFLLIAMFGVSATLRASDQTHTGALDDDQPTFSTTFDLNQGESVYITADATTGDLDTYLSLQNPEGVIIVENDDRDYEQLNSALGYTAATAGTYTITLSRLYDDSRGNYELSIVVGDESVLDDLDTQADEMELSGEMLTLDTAHFRIHYTLDGRDAVSEDFAYQVAKAMEFVWQDQVVERGWPAPPGDGRNGGSAQLDVYLTDSLDEIGDGELGAARPGHQFGDNPNTAALEQYATSAILRLDNDFEEIEWDGNALNLMRATAAHEFHHAVQYGYDFDDLSWYNEATSVWMETQTFPKYQDATGYVEYTYRYPELCFGTEDDPDEGMLMYGEWLFIQSLVDTHGDKALFSLWNSIAQYDGFEALEETLDFFGETVPQALARYRLQNLVRDYKLAPEFGGATVWLSSDITEVGRVDGDGVQELGANYFAFNPPAGTYHISVLDEDDADLEVWAMGIDGREASAMPLGSGGVITTGDYDYVYLMVFNPTYHNDVDDCEYSSYALDIVPVDAPPTPALYTWDAKHFLPLTSD